MKGLVIWIGTEEGSDEAILDELGREIGERGGRVEVFHSETIESLGMVENDRAKAAACAMLASHGVVVIASGAKKPGINTGEKYEIRQRRSRPFVRLTLMTVLSEISNLRDWFPRLNMMYIQMRKRKY